jgi:hypothetical protein
MELFENLANDEDSKDLGKGREKFWDEEEINPNFFTKRYRKMEGMAAQTGKSLALCSDWFLERICIHPPR